MKKPSKKLKKSIAKAKKFIKKEAKAMAKKEKAKQELEVWASNCKLSKDGVNIKIESGSGFFDDKRDNAPNKIKITVEEL